MKQIYFIAVLPTEKIQQEVTQFKKYAAEHFDSSHALKSPPHITLQSPFKWEREEQERLEKTLEQFAKQQEPFFLTLRNFDNFQPRVIFVDVEKSEALNQLQAQLRKELEQQLQLHSDDRYGFHAHMTVAFKDLKRWQFPGAWSYFSQQEYHRQFEVEAITLLWHMDKRWEIVKDFVFSGGRLASTFV